MLTRTLRWRLAAGDDLPGLPAVVVEVRRLARSKDTPPAALADALSRDPALVAKFLKYASAVQMGRGKEIASVQHAIMMVGLNTAKRACLDFSLGGGRQGSESLSGLDLGETWRRSLVSAVSAQALADRIGDHSRDEAFLCGLLVHFGKLVLDRYLPEQYAEVFASHVPSGWPSIRDEEKALGFHSAEVGAAVLEDWGLPDRVVRTVAYVHRPDEFPSRYGASFERFVAMMHLNSLFEGLLCDDNPETSTIKAYAKARGFGFGARDVEFFLTGLTPAIRNVSEILHMEMPKDLPDEDILERARQGIPEDSPGASELDPRDRRVVKAGEEEPLPSFEEQIDVSTGLPNRHAFYDYLTHQVELRLSAATPGCLGLILVRLDELAGAMPEQDPWKREELLCRISRSLVGQTRKNDLWARYGRNVLAVVLANSVPIGIKALTNRLGATIARESVEVGGGRLPLTASFGASWLGSVETKRDGRALVLQAHRQLQRARREGGNRCARRRVERRPA